MLAKLPGTNANDAFWCRKNVNLFTLQCKILMTYLNMKINYYKIFVNLLTAKVYSREIFYQVPTAKVNVKKFAFFWHRESFCPRKFLPLK